jgi:hypothetical protein
MKSARPAAKPAEGTSGAYELMTADASGVSGQVGSGEASPETKRLTRKIIYTAKLQLAVEQFETIPSQVSAIVNQFSAYIARSNLTGLPGAARHGEWTIRVPVDRYDKCLDALRGLGEIQSEGADSKDVSEEFYDLKARIQNKKKQEERLLTLLAEATGKLEEVLKVEGELARVRGEIEQMTGRLRVLSDLTAMATIHLTVQEIKNYVPAKAPGYTTRVRRAFDASLDQLVTTAQNASILLVALAPWLAVFVLIAPVVWAVVRVCRRRKT